MVVLVTPLRLRERVVFRTKKRIFGHTLGFTRDNRAIVDRVRNGCGGLTDIPNAL